MRKICVLVSPSDLSSLVLIKELKRLHVDFDVCWIIQSKSKKKYRYGRFIGMNCWTYFFWKDLISQKMFGFSKIQQEILKDFLPFSDIYDIAKPFFPDSLAECRDFIYQNNYKYVLVGGIPILPKFFFEKDDLRFIGCHPAPLPQVRGEDHLVFTLYYGLNPSVSIYQLNEYIDGGDVYMVAPLDITLEDTFYSIKLKLEVHRGKILASFAKRIEYNLQINPIENKGKLHKYSDVTIRIRKKAEENLKKILRR